MKKKETEKDVLVVRDEKTGEIGVVAGLKSDGTPNVTGTKPENGQAFLRFDRNGDVLDNFFSNFFRQCKEPKRFGFYRVTADGVENVLAVLKDLLKNPEANKELLVPHLVDTEKYEKLAKQEQTETLLKEKTPQEQSEAKGQQPEAQQGDKQKKEYQPIDESRINWPELEEKWGVNRQSLEASGDLKKMLNFGKSSLVTVAPKFGDERFETEARLSFKVLPNGNVQLVPHLIRKEPQLDKAFEGYSFSAEDKDHLKKTGNMGRIAQLTDKNTGKTVPAYISIDRLTNNVVAIPVNKVRIPDKIGNTALTEQDIKTLRSGQPISNKEIILANGKKFTATLQVNVEQRGVEFVPHSSQLKQENSQGKKIEKQEEKQQSKDNRFQWLDANGNIRAPKTFGGVTLTPEQQSDYTAGKTILVKDMVHDKQGQPYTAYIKFNQEEGKPKYYRSDPDVSHAQQVIPASENRTQVAVNSDGKTNEATKHIGKPMLQEQTAPINKQQEQRQNKPKGIGV
ncbi:MAG: DUF3945 domain-containing protein [Paludibacter sp.]|nr:DUF3945 domain-containing protein [Paludibacter sp.]